MSDNVDICLVEQELPIDVRRFQNPVTDEGDIRMQSIDSSERIADLINSFGTVSDIEECYMVILDGIQEAFYARSMAGRSALCVANADDSIMEAENSVDNIMEMENLADAEQAKWYVALSREIQRMSMQNAGEKTDEHFSENEV
ncbi:MAG: hypothetical protein K1W20_00730 [Lachnospiraceae bacterium]